MLVNTRVGNGNSLGNYISQTRAFLRVKDIGLKWSAAAANTLTRLKQLRYSTNQKQPVTVDFIRAVMNDGAVPLVLRVVIAVAFRLGARVHEIIAKRVVRSGVTHWLVPIWRSSVRWDTVTGDYALRNDMSKSDKYNKGTDMFLLNTGKPNCITRWFGQYFNNLPAAEADTPLFVFDDGTPVQYQHVLSVFKSHAHVIGLTPEQVGTHSARIGFIFTAKNNALQWDLVDAVVRWAPQSAAAMHLVYDRMSRERLMQAAAAVDTDNPAAVPLAVVSRRLQLQQ